MKFYYKTKKQEFDENWEKTRAWYRENGMSEEAIQEMHDFDWEQFKASRIYALHTQELDDIETTINGDEHENLFVKRYEDRFTTDYDSLGGHSRFWWMEEISLPQVSKILCSLSEEEKNLMTLYFADGFTQAECASILHISQRSVCNYLNRILCRITEK